MRTPSTVNATSAERMRSTATAIGAERTRSTATGTGADRTRSTATATGAERTRSAAVDPCLSTATDVDPRRYFLHRLQNDDEAGEILGAPSSSTCSARCV